MDFKDIKKYIWAQNKKLQYEHLEKSKDIINIEEENQEKLKIKKDYDLPN